jgi:hypothetical protein
MYQIPITSVPNQSLSFNVDGAYWQLHIYQSIDNMCADVTLAGANVISGHRCLAGVPLMPYPYMHEPNYGNFVFDNIVDWTDFGIGCNLYYLDAAEWTEFKQLGFLQVND